MNTPHKHAELIKAWADGVKIEYEHSAGGWYDCSSTGPCWCPNVKYRIKPVEKSPGQLLAETQDYCWATCNLASRLNFEAIAIEFLASLKGEK